MSCWNPGRAHLCISDCLYPWKQRGNPFVLALGNGASCSISSGVSQALLSTCLSSVARCQDRRRAVCVLSSPGVGGEEVLFVGGWVGVTVEPACRGSAGLPQVPTGVLSWPEHSAWTHLEHGELPGRRSVWKISAQGSRVQMPAGVTGLMPAFLLGDLVEMTRTSLLCVTEGPAARPPGQASEARHHPHLSPSPPGLCREHPARLPSWPSPPPAFPFVVGSAPPHPPLPKTVWPPWFLGDMDGGGMCQRTCQAWSGRLCPGCARRGRGCWCTGLGGC